MNAITSTCVLSLAALCACAASPPPELRDARAEYVRASNGLAAQLTPADLHVAGEQLAVANASFQDHGGTPETRDLAYAAWRKVQLAEVRAQTIASQQQRTDTEAQIAQQKDAQVRLTSAKLSATEQALASQTQQLAVAQREKMEADRRASQAAADLARIASVKHEDRGMVITLSGAVLFASGKYDLLPQAQAKLGEVANVLSKQDPDSKIVVQGYTDSQGGDTFNLELSRQRAEAVRGYLVSHGIASDRVRAEGFGPAKPIADNASAEGRADNRRVEIVVEAKH